MLCSWGAAPTDDQSGYRRLKRKKTEPEAAPLFPAEPAWLVTLAAPPSAPGAMDDDRVYVPIQSGEVVALDRETGTPAWTAAIETRWAPLATGVRVIVAAADAMYAVDASTGREQWAVPFRALSTGLSAGGDRVFAVTSDQEAIAVRASDGSILWRRTLDAAAIHPPVVAGALVAISLEGSRLIALDAQTGTVAWSRTLEGTLSPPVAARDRVLVGSTTNWLYALHAKHGDEVWKYRVGGDVIGAAVDGDIVYFASLDNILRAVNRSNGNQRWKTVIPTRPAAPPVAFDGLVVLSGVAPRVDGFVGKTGAAQGFYAALADLEGTALVDPTLDPYRVAMIAITRDGRVSALRSQPMMMRDPATSPLTELPGRRLERERLPPRAQ